MTKYLSAIGNEFATKALEGALPVGLDSPQRRPYGAIESAELQHAYDRCWQGHQKHFDPSKP